MRQERKVMGEIIADVIGQQQPQNIGDGAAGDDGNEHFGQKPPERQQKQAQERKNEKSETGEQDFGLDFVVQDHRVFVRVQKQHEREHRQEKQEQGRMQAKGKGRLLSLARFFGCFLFIFGNKGRFFFFVFSHSRFSVEQMPSSIYS